MPEVKYTQKRAVLYGVVGKNMGLRECAAIFNCARKHKCRIQISFNRNTGTSDSIISLFSIRVRKNTFVVIEITGKELNAACLECIDALDFVAL